MKVIDFHHHVFPPEFKIHPWSFQQDQMDMRSLEFNGAVLSCVLPVDKEQARKINRQMAEVSQMDPKHYKFLASIPFDNVMEAIKEIDYAVDILHASGICLPTNNHGIYISDDRMDPIFDELNRRKAVVFLHPSALRAPGNNLRFSGCDDTVYEFVFETTRAMMDYIYRDKMLRTSDISWVLSHAGGTIPFLSYRLSRAGDWNAISQSSEEIEKQLKSIYYDLALADNESVFRLMKDFCTADHIVFGSDYPPSAVPNIAEAAEHLQKADVFTRDEKEKILYQNVSRLLDFIV